MVEEFILEAKYLILHSVDFMCHLPTSLLCLHLIARELRKIYPITRMVKWPLLLSDFGFQNLNIDYRTLEWLNMNQSRLEKITINKGNIQTLNANLFPITVIDLFF